MQASQDLLILEQNNQKVDLSPKQQFQTELFQKHSQKNEQLFSLYCNFITKVGKLFSKYKL